MVTLKRYQRKKVIVNYKVWIDYINRVSRFNFFLFLSVGPDIESLGLTELFFRFAVWDKLEKKNFFHPISELQVLFFLFFTIPSFLFSEPPLPLDTLYYWVTVS